MSGPEVGVMLRRELPPERLAPLAAEIGPQVDSLWIVEDLEFSGGIAQLASVLDAVPDVPVGHGLAPAPFRSPVALAMEWATLSRRHPGRLRPALGHGVGSWMDRLGASVASPLTLLEETADAVGALLRGERVTREGRYVRLDDVGLRYPPSEVPPLLLGVTGPRSLALSGRLADGTLLPEYHGPDELTAARRHVAREIDEHPFTVFVMAHVGPTGSEPPPPAGLTGGWMASGPDAETVVDRLAELGAAGAAELVLVVGDERPEDDLRRLVELVLPAIRRRFAQD